MENLTCVVPYRNGDQTIERLLDSLPKEIPVIVADDLSDVPYKTNRANVKVIRLSKRGYFSGGCNRAIQECSTDVLIMNQDAFLENYNWSDLDKQRETFAMIGNGVVGHPAWINGYIDGIFLFLRRDAINALGTVFDEDLYPLWGATCLAQLRLCRQGFEALPLKIKGLRHERKGNYGTAIAQTLQDEPDKQGLLIRTPPEISVIITCHNYGRFLKDAVNSLIGGMTSLGEMKPQSFQSFEVIIVDDYSTDESPEIIRELIDPWKGIRAIRLDVIRGSAAAMNIGIQAAYGKVIAPLDADDMMESNRLETLYRVWQQNQHSVVYDDPMTVVKNQRKDAWRLPEYDFDLVLNKNPMHKGALYSKEAWRESGGYPEIMMHGREDWAFNIALGIHGYCGIHVPQALYLYRRHENNRTKTNTTEEWRRRFFQQLFQLYPEIYAGDRPKMCCGGGKQNLNRGANPGGRGANAFNAKNLPLGENGMVMMQYLGAKSTQSYFGAVTHTRYLFGGQRVAGYIDARDVEGLINLLEARKPAFQVYQKETA